MNCLVFDTETTSLLQSRLMVADRQPHIIQFCGIVANLTTGDIVDEYTTFVKPPRIEAVTEKITEITRITPDLLTQAPGFIKVADRILNLIASCSMVAAHNLSFDKEMIELECKRIDRTVKWPARLICTVEQTIHLKGFRLDLGSLHELLLGMKFEDAHRADVDTKALVRCLVEMQRREWL